MFVALLTATVLAVITVVSVQRTALRTLPRIVATISPEPMALQLEIRNIHEIGPCRRSCLLARLAGSNKTRYGVTIEN